MSTPPSAWLSNSTYNKLKGSYVNGDVDASQNVIIRNGNLYLAPNSNIYSTNNYLFFDDVYSFINTGSFHIYGLLKLDYNLVEYDVGYEIVDVIKPQIATNTTNIASLTTSTNTNTLKLTNIAYNSGTNTTTFTGVLSFPATSIASASINNSSFVTLTGGQTIAGIKNFSSTLVAVGNIRLDGDLKLATNTITVTNATLQKINYLSNVTSDVNTSLTTLQNNINAINTSALLSLANTWTLQNTFSNNIRLDGSLLVGTAGATVLSNATLEKIQYLSNVTTDISGSLTTLQTNINNINTSALLSTANTWSQIQTFTFPPVMSGSSITNLSIPNSALATTYIDNSSSQSIGGIKTFSSPPVMSGASITAGTIPDSALVSSGFVNLTTAQTIGGIKTFSSPPVMSGASISASTIPNSALATQYLDLTTNQSLAATKTLTILGNIIANAFTITPTILGYLNGVTSNIQTQFTGCAKTATANTFTQQQTFNNANSIRIDGSLLLNAGAMTITNTVLQYLNGVTSNIQTQFSGCAKIATTNTFALAQTFSSLIITNGGISTGAAAITTPKVQSTGDLEITTPTSNTLYLNSNKTNGDIRINTGSLGSNTYIDNGFLNIYQPVTGGSTTFKATTGILTGGGVNDFCEVVSLATGNYGLQLQGGVKQGVGDQFNLAFNNGGVPINILTAVNTGTPSTNNLNLTGQLNINGTNILSYQPVGTIITNISSLGIGLPFLICNGLAISRTTYSVLFSMIGTNYGVGDGSTTFNIPNYNGMFLRGQGSQTLGGVTYSSGASLSTFQEDTLQDHNHGGQSGTYLASTNGSVSGYGWAAVATQRPNSNTFTNTSGVTAAYRSSTETRPANYGVYYYIRVI